MAMNEVLDMVAETEGKITVLAQAPTDISAKPLGHPPPEGLAGGEWGTTTFVGPQTGALAIAALPAASAFAPSNGKKFNTGLASWVKKVEPDAPFKTPQTAPSTKRPILAVSGAKRTIRMPFASIPSHLRPVTLPKTTTCSRTT